MEHSIGEIVTLPDGRKAEVVETALPYCQGCIMQQSHKCATLKEKGLLGYCLYANRTDGKNVIYKEIKN